VRDTRAEPGHELARATDQALGAEPDGARGQTPGVCAAAAPHRDDLIRGVLGRVVQKSAIASHDATWPAQGLFAVAGAPARALLMSPKRYVIGSDIVRAEMP